MLLSFLGHSLESAFDHCSLYWVEINDLGNKMHAENMQKT